MVYYCFTHITLFSGVFHFQFSHDTHRAMQDSAVTCGFYRLLIKNRWFWLSSDPKFVVGLRCVLISGIMMRNVSTTKHSACWHAKSFYFLIYMFCQRCVAIQTVVHRFLSSTTYSVWFVHMRTSLFEGWLSKCPYCLCLFFDFYAVVHYLFTFIVFLFLLVLTRSCCLWFITANWHTRWVGLISDGWFQPFLSWCSSFPGYPQRLNDK